MNQCVPKIKHPMSITNNHSLPCIDFDLGDTLGNMHLMRMLVDTGAATNI